MKYLLAIIIFILLSQGSVFAEDFVVVVNSEGPLVAVEMDMVKDIFLGEKRFLGKVRLTPVNFSEGAIKDSFFSAILDMSSREYKLYWIKKAFQEGVALPKSYGDGEYIIDMVKKDKGIVAYLPESMAGRVMLDRGMVILE